MEFSQKYISTTEKAAVGPTDERIVLSDDAFAIGEMLSLLNFRLSRITK
jgi:hypothetical protein